jgi:hypothetical protein
MTQAKLIPVIENVSEKIESVIDEWMQKKREILDWVPRNPHETDVRKEQIRIISVMETYIIAIDEHVTEYNKEILKAQHELLAKSNLPVEAKKRYVEDIMGKLTI